MKTAYLKKKIQKGMIQIGMVIMLTFALTVVSYGAEAQEFKIYSLGGSHGTVRWETKQLIGFIPAKGVPISVFNKFRDNTDFMLSDDAFSYIAVMRPAKLLWSVEFVEKMANPMTREWAKDGVPSVDNTSKMVKGHSDYYLQVSDKRIDYYYTGEEKITQVNIMPYLTDYDGCSGGDRVSEYALLLSEEDEAYFMEHGTIPGLGDYTWPKLREMLNSPTKLSNTTRKTATLKKDDGESMEVDLYEAVMGHTNYFNFKEFNGLSEKNDRLVKVRDMAEFLNGTSKQFNVAWNNEKNTLEITTGVPYESVKSESKSNDSEIKWADMVDAQIVIDGRPVRLVSEKTYQCPGYQGELIKNVYMIDGNYYFPFAIWDSFVYTYLYDGTGTEGIYEESPNCYRYTTNVYMSE